MGARKHISAEKIKEARKNLYFAKLNGVPSSPRKMRYVVDMVRGMEVNRALGVLRFSKKQAAADVEKLLRSAIANWETKNDRKAEDGELFITKVFVDEGVQAQRTELAAVAGLLDPAEWQAAVSNPAAVDDRHPGFNLAGDFFSVLDVARDDGRTQPVAGVVG